jgi:hypothetical protein
VEVFWIQFVDATALPPGMHLGCGITAYDQSDVMQIFADRVHISHPDLKIASVRRVLSIDELEQGHVRPNMGNFLIRGIWFPLGYS